MTSNSRHIPALVICSAAANALHCGSLSSCSESGSNSLSSSSSFPKSSSSSSKISISSDLGTSSGVHDAGRCKQTNESVQKKSYVSCDENFLRSAQLIGRGERATG
uniref:Uncharacterized protein n=1 Tax=Glossina pallidipes TaxID=7398 RepID=A0A1B0A3D2_GLOPL